MKQWHLDMRDRVAIIRPQGWEVSLKLAPLYAGAYVMYLRDLCDIAFVPFIEQKPPYVLPENADTITTQQEARVLTAAIGNHIITPGEGGIIRYVEEVTCDMFTDRLEHTVRYVPLEQFVAFQDDLEQCSEISGRVSSGITCRQLERFKVMQFVLSTLLDTR